MEAASVVHCSRTPLLRKHQTSWQKRFGGPFSRVAIALILTLVAQPASAQLVGSRSVQAAGCASAAVGGDVRDTTITTVCGMPSEQVVELVRLAASPQAGDRAELMARLSALVPASSQLRVEAIAKFFQLLGEAPVEESQLADRFAQIAAEHRRLVEDVKSLRVNDPEVQALRQQAAAALEIADHATAFARLTQARTIVTTKRETLARVLDDQKREEAALVFEQARVELARLAYEQAAELFTEAARLLPAGDTETRWHYMMAKADAEQTMGDERANNPALVRAVESYRAGLALASRTERPLDWAATQNNLGNALRILGERETGTAKLDEAVAVYREALQERTRERVPLHWAETQNNLGLALWRLGERDTGPTRLQEAIAAFREALKEWTRERAPLLWGATQNNLGIVLDELGERESGTAKLKEAVATYREALKELTRERVPLDWAQTQDNLGNALSSLGSRENRTPLLQEAVSAHREALKERTRERVPLQWAQTQDNLGNALLRLGEREAGTTKLEEAVAARHEALKERTRERVPLQWAATQNNLGHTLSSLGERESGTPRLEEAIVAHREARKEWTRERVPLDWARSLGSEGLTLMVLAQRRGDAAMAKTALSQINTAFEILRDGGDAPGAAYYEQNLTTARALVARLAVLVVVRSAVLWKHRRSSTARKNSEI
jgi:tetratricopeptide (TPR) repeat protein